MKQPKPSKTLGATMTTRLQEEKAKMSLLAHWTDLRSQFQEQGLTKAVNIISEAANQLAKTPIYSPDDFSELANNLPSSELKDNLTIDLLAWKTVLETNTKLKEDTNRDDQLKVLQA